MPFADCVQQPFRSVSPVIESTAGTDRTVVWAFQDESGSPREFGEEDSVKFIVREYTGARELYLSVQGDIDHEEGTVSFYIPGEKTKKSGLWSAAVAVYNEEGIKTDEYKAWLRIMPSTASRGTGSQPPIDIADIREILWDRFAEDNFLLDACEFEDHQVASAAQWVVDKWNETPPPVGTYTIITFPWRHHHAIGAASRLLRTAAMHQSRNTLQYQAGGVGIQDKGKHTDYMKMYQSLEQEFLEWMGAKKMEINTSLAWGTLNSGGIF